MNNLRKKLTVLLLAGAVVVATGTSAHAVTGVTGVHTSGTVACISPGSTFGGGVNLKAYAPTMKAVNSTSAVDSQKVTMQPVIFRWNGTAWVQYSNGVLLKGTATDASSPTTWSNASTGASWGTGTENFTLPPAGYYAVAYRMSWYSGSTVSGSDYLWAAGYSLQSPIGAPNATISYCTT